MMKAHVLRAQPAVLLPSRRAPTRGRRLSLLGLGVFAVCVGLAAGALDLVTRAVLPSVLVTLCTGFALTAARPERSWRWSLPLGLGAVAAHWVGAVAGRPLSADLHPAWALVLGLPALLGVLAGREHARAQAPPGDRREAPRRLVPGR